MRRNNQGSAQVLLLAAASVFGLAVATHGLRDTLVKYKSHVLNDKQAKLEELNKSAIRTVDQYFRNEFLVPRYDPPGVRQEGTAVLSAIAPPHLQSAFDAGNLIVTISQCDPAESDDDVAIFAKRPTGEGVCRPMLTEVTLNQVNWAAKEVSVAARTQWFATALGFTQQGPVANPERTTKALLALKYIPQCCTWTGLVSSDWHTAGNWDHCDGRVPGANDSIAIDGGAPNQPAVVAAGLPRDFRLVNSLGIFYGPPEAGFVMVRSFCSTADELQTSALGGTQVGTVETKQGGTITVGSGVRFFVWDPNKSFQSNVAFKGDSPTCTDCDLAFTCNNCYVNTLTREMVPAIYDAGTQTWQRPAMAGHPTDWSYLNDWTISGTIVNNATLTLKPGIRVRGHLKTLGPSFFGQTTGHLVASGDAALGHWIYFSTPEPITFGWGGYSGGGLSGFSLGGPEQRPSTASLTGVKFEGCSSCLWVHSGGQLLKLDGTEFELSPIVDVNTDWAFSVQSYVYLACAKSFVVSRWNDVTFKGFGFTSRYDTYSNVSDIQNADPIAYPCGRKIALTPTSPDESEIRITGTGNFYGSGLENDPGSIIQWENGAAHHCVWTGASSRVWEDASNWSCANGRGGYPDQNDYAEVPAAIANQPLMPVKRFSLAGIKGGGGTITIPPGGQLLLYDSINTIQGDITIRGSTVDCTTCNLEAAKDLSIVNGATLTMGGGVTLYMKDFRNINVGQFDPAGIVGGGKLVVNSDPAYPQVFNRRTTNYNDAEWAGIRVKGTAAMPSQVTIDGLKLVGVGLGMKWEGLYPNNYVKRDSAIRFVSDFEVPVLKNLEVRLSGSNDWRSNSYALAEAPRAVIRFDTCPPAISPEPYALKVTGGYWSLWAFYEFTTADLAALSVYNFSLASDCGFPLTVKTDATGLLVGESYKHDPYNKLQFVAP